MLGSLLTFLGAIYALLSGLGLLPRWLSVSALVLLAAGTVPVVAFSVYVSLMEFITTRHGRVKLLVHSFLKSSLSPLGYKKAIRLLPQRLLYCDLFSGILFEGNTTLVIFYNCCAGGNTITVLVEPKLEKYERRFIQASIFILMLKRRILLKKGPKYPDKRETQVDIRDYNYRVTLINNDLEIEIQVSDRIRTRRNKVFKETYQLVKYQAEGEKDRDNERGKFFLREYRRSGLIVFDYVRDILWMAKDHNRYLVKHGCIDLTSITRRELVHYAIVGQSRNFLNGEFCRVG
ncbi:hypothetical protein R1flu_010147 [Riccia fluitans]|uniref:Uncharacterized protein n=1 Tax=Riccia fluitans TaxID=41844 RepID=A0ABD1Z4Y3_9MARC